MYFIYKSNVYARLQENQLFSLDSIIIFIKTTQKEKNIFLGLFCQVFYRYFIILLIYSKTVIFSVGTKGQRPDAFIGKEDLKYTK